MYVYNSESSEVITVTLLSMIGLYHLCHLLHALLDKLVTYSAKHWRHYGKYLKMDFYEVQEKEPLIN